MADKRTVLVSGATGHQGGAVARALLGKGYRVRAMTRNPDSEGARALEELGAEIVRGDFDDESTLEEPLREIWGVFSVQNTWEAGVQREETQGKRFAERAREAGVGHFVYSSVGSAHLKTGIPHFDNKARVEEVVRGLGFPSYTIIRPVFFMENFLSPWFKPGIDQGQLVIGVKPDTTLQMIAVEDIGRHGLRAFEEHDALNGHAIDVAGDELAMPEAARVIGKAAGREVAFVQAPIEEVRKFSEDFAVMLEWFDRVGYSVDIPRLASASGVEPVSFPDWAGRADWS